MSFSKSFWYVSSFSIIWVPLVLCALYYKNDTLINIQSIFTFSKEYIYSVVKHDNTLHSITLTEDGFKPEVLTIQLNDTVVFKTTRNVPFWPASSIHPEHKIYPEFDSKKPIDQNLEWSFTFKKIGRFSFHDHIFANYIGKIIVVDSSTTNKEKTLDINTCSRLTISEKSQCWDEQLQEVLQTNGLDAAFDYFIDLYNTEPNIPKECHGWGHLLGKAGYTLYKNGEVPEFRSEVSYCGYGFFHGFIAELIKDTGDVKQTQEFCKYVVKTMSGDLQSIAANCIHGVGHGTASLFIEDPQNWGDLEKITKSALTVCGKVFSEKRDLENCYDGVFNETYVELANSNYGLNFQEYLLKGDVYWFCDTQEKQYKKSCYYEYAGLLGTIFNEDVVESTRFALERIPDLEKNGEKVIARIAADHIEKTIVNENHTDSIEACALSPQFLSDACFKGIINGFLQHGEPQNFHVKALTFCKELPTTHPNSKSCENLVLEIAKTEYSTQQRESVCTKESLLCN